MSLKALIEFEVRIRLPTPLPPLPRRLGNVGGDGLNIER